MLGRGEFKPLVCKQEQEVAAVLVVTRSGWMNKWNWIIRRSFTLTHTFHIFLCLHPQRLWPHNVTSDDPEFHSVSCLMSALIYCLPKISQIPFCMCKGVEIAVFHGFPLHLSCSVHVFFLTVCLLFICCGRVLCCLMDRVEVNSQLRPVSDVMLMQVTWMSSFCWCLTLIIGWIFPKVEN